MKIGCLVQAEPTMQAEDHHLAPYEPRTSNVAPYILKTLANLHDIARSASSSWLHEIMRLLHIKRDGTVGA